MLDKATYFVVLILLFSCAKKSTDDTPRTEDLPENPAYFPEVSYPEDNEFSEARWVLGKKLFFDPVMSVDKSISCASCHKPELAFADNRSISPGVEGRLGTRNAPSLANVAFHPYYTREGGLPTLEMQVLVPIQEHAEFDYNIVDLSERLMKDSIYVEMSRKAYDLPPNPFVISRALACFERTLISGRSKYDLFLTSKNIFVFSMDERLGMELFFSDRLACSNCHSGYDFSDYSFSNNGLYENYQDPGRYRLTRDENDKHMFKIPSLRNVELTAPYMHDGSIETLDAVIEHYNSGGKNNSQKSKLIKPLSLTVTEKQQLKAFLLTLTDKNFISNTKYHDEK